ncbi:hypothetical protein GIB67_036547 [Kingdonia uniflora]|uniref:Uncharacterized protein n=1 Tax=Kingdonia uniflora TaxID=39325 RepID=A0A7J7NZI7_9MAGN|nr:hypothetical protein GIB67_036547 [Kingdonia uniflora]
MGQQQSDVSPQIWTKITMKEKGEEFSSETKFSGRHQEKEFDRDPEFAEILGSVLDDLRKLRPGELVEQLRLTNLAKASASAKRRDRSRRKGYGGGW